MNNLKLTVELVPESSWFDNLRSRLSKSLWDVLRKRCYAAAGYVCEVCGNRGETHPVECHEVWEYDDDNNTQTLLGLIALCPDCHKVKHLGLAKIKGWYPEAVEHFADVNGLSTKEALSYVDAAFEQWEERNKKKWTIDVSWIDQILK